LPSLPAAREIARALATDYLGFQTQTDTYFRCQQGRLKLREIAGEPAVLIAYARPDQPGPKESDYFLIPASHPAELKAGLLAALGVACVVRKRREIFLDANVRIHLDEVEGLGTFLEFEAVIVDDADAARAPQQIAELRQRFGIADADLFAGSYAEMLS
jgi:adenylate cyclase class IV